MSFGGTTGYHTSARRLSWVDVSVLYPVHDNIPLAEQQFTERESHRQTQWPYIGINYPLIRGNKGGHAFT